MKDPKESSRDRRIKSTSSLVLRNIFNSSSFSNTPITFKTWSPIFTPCSFVKNKALVFFPHLRNKVIHALCTHLTCKIRGWIFLNKERLTCTKASKNSTSSKEDSRWIMINHHFHLIVVTWIQGWIQYKNWRMIWIEFKPNSSFFFNQPHYFLHISLIWSQIEVIQDFIKR